MSNVVGTSPHDWTYVSEGGATIVFSYTGPSKPHFNGTVLRLRKTALAPHDERPDEAQTDDPTIAFQTKVMARLIPNLFLPRLESVGVDKTWLREIGTLCTRQRPPERREKDDINLTRMTSVLATDLVGKEPLVVEIKVRIPCRYTLLTMTCLIIAQMGVPPISYSSIATQSPREDPYLQILHALIFQVFEAGDR
jgi:inositol-pentakisphosphate 2-kinase